MSYLHCPTCKRAYNLAVHPLCPTCPVPSSVVDPREDIVSAAEQLARAMARATPAERGDAMRRMDQLALGLPPGPQGNVQTSPASYHGGMLRSIRGALEPAPPTTAARPAQPLLAAIAFAVLERIGERAPRLRQLGAIVRARVRALAA